jgi:triphosphatase
MEVELKFRLTAETQRAALAYLADMELPKPVVRRLASHYYDFPDLSLAGAGLRLRVRKSGRHHEQTLKAPGAGSAAAQRSEWTWPLASSRPDIARLDGTPAAKIFAQKRDAEIELLFVTDIRRTAYRLNLEGGTVAELAIDHGEIRANGHSETMRELEIELKSGHVGPLYRFASALNEASPLDIAPDSKADRGYRLFTGKPPVASKTGDVTLAPHIDTAHGLRRIVGSGLGQLVAKLPFCSVGDPEPLHQARIAIRRIRSALALFEPCLEPEATARFEDTLRHFGRILGGGRDQDVFVKEIKSAFPKPAATAPGFSC